MLLNDSQITFTVNVSKCIVFRNSLQEHVLSSKFVSVHKLMYVRREQLAGRAELSS